MHYPQPSHVHYSALLHLLVIHRSVFLPVVRVQEERVSADVDSMGADDELSGAWSKTSPLSMECHAPPACPPPETSRPRRDSFANAFVSSRLSARSKRMERNEVGRILSTCLPATRLELELRCALPLARPVPFHTAPPSRLLPRRLSPSNRVSLRPTQSNSKLSNPTHPTHPTLSDPLKSRSNLVA